MAVKRTKRRKDTSFFTADEASGEENGGTASGDHHDKNGECKPENESQPQAKTQKIGEAAESASKKRPKSYRAGEQAGTTTTTSSWFTLPMGLIPIFITIPIGLLFYLYFNTNIVSSHSSSSTPGPVIRVINGQLQSMENVSRRGRKFYEYLGIPYAKPPIGQLRFEPPKPALNWNGVLVANSFGSPCAQIEFFTGKLLGNEDCLYLNVFTPVNDHGRDANREVPVMVFIHGGYFMSGSATIYSPKYFMDRDVVLVTLNYRLASLGFLNTGDGVVRGNMGLKDQNMALRWVQANIKAFGGDPERVTLFGPSAGAAAVHYHTLSPLSKGLFHKAISQSGVAIKVWALVENPREQAHELGRKLNCPTDDSRQLVACLKKLDANQIISTHADYRDVLLDPLSIYAPSIEMVIDESTFLPAHPYSILVQGKENQVPWMTGLNSDEGLLFTSRVLKNPELMTKLSQDIDETWPLLLAYSRHPNKAGITPQVKKFYFGDAHPDFNTGFQNYTNMLSDRLYMTAAHEAILLQSRNTSVYTYYYTYPARFSFSQVLTLSGTLPPILELIIMLAKRWIKENLFGTTLDNYGVCHGDELIMLFDLGLLSRIKPGDPEYEISKKMIKLWVDFATLPTQPMSTNDFTLNIDGIQWKPIPSYPAQINYLNLDKIVRIIPEPFTERVHFWKSVGLL